MVIWYRNDRFNAYPGVELILVNAWAEETIHSSLKFTASFPGFFSVPFHYPLRNNITKTLSLAREMATGTQSRW